VVVFAEPQAVSVCQHLAPLAVNGHAFTARQPSFAGHFSKILDFCASWYEYARMRTRGMTRGPRKSKFLGENLKSLFVYLLAG
jgi:hypothetical protein